MTRALGTRFQNLVMGKQEALAVLRSQAEVPQNHPEDVLALA